MIATLWAVQFGPWPGQDGPDLEGFCSAVEILAVIARRIESGHAGADDRTRYRIASATIERGARKLGRPEGRFDATDLLAWLQGTATPTVFPPHQVATFGKSTAIALAGAGDFAIEMQRVINTVMFIQAGLIITLDPYVDPTVKVFRATTRPDRPSVARSVLPDPALADVVAALPHTADIVFAEDRYRLGDANTLRRQIYSAIRTGEPLAVGSQAKHDVLTEVFRELHHPNAPTGRFRMMWATEATETTPYPFGPLPPDPGTAGNSLHVGLMSMRHTEIDSEVSGYWFRNRLVSVPGRSHAESEAYCHRDSLVRLHRLADSGVTDLFVRHTGFEPAALGFYRAVAEVVAARTLRIHPSYLASRGKVVAGTSWPSTGAS